MELQNVRDFPKTERAYAKNRISRTARGMVGRAGLLEDDVPDLEQDLWVDLLVRYQKYKPDLGPIRAFIDCIVRNKAASILKARRAAKRADEIRMISLNQEIEDEEGNTIERHETFSEDDYLRRTRGAVLSKCDRLDLAIDLCKVLESVPPECGAVCLLLIDRDVCDVANVVGIPRSTLRDLIQKMREEPAFGRLRKYLK